MATEPETIHKKALAVSYWKGTIAAVTVVGVGYGFKSMGASDFWSLLAPMALVGIWVVGYGSALARLVGGTSSRE